MTTTQTTTKKPVTVAASAQGPAVPAVVATATPSTPAVAVTSATQFPPTHLVRVVAAANPKRPGTKAHAKWALYANVKTVAEMVAAFEKAGHKRRRAMSALRWDTGHGFVMCLSKDGFDKYDADQKAKSKAA